MKQQKKPDLKPAPELTYELEGAPPKLFVIKNRTGGWWGPDGAGYFDSLLRAGTYTQAQLARCNVREDEDKVVPLAEAVRELGRPNPFVLAALAAAGGR